MAQFTQSEKDIINNGTAEIPFRVLKITDPQDSIFLRQKCTDIDDNRIGRSQTAYKPS